MEQGCIYPSCGYCRRVYDNAEFCAEYMNSNIYIEKAEKPKGLYISMNISYLLIPDNTYH